MSNLANIPENILTIDVDIIPVIYTPPAGNIIVRHRVGCIYLSIGSRDVELNTLTAHGIGYSIAMAIPQLAPDEMIVITINGERVELLGPIASKVSTALLRKADDADDWQLKHRRKSA